MKNDQGEYVPPRPAETPYWSTALEKVDTIQARAQLEALRRIAEELHTLNDYLSSGRAEALAALTWDPPVPDPPEGR